jgi:hypothetical protein
LFLPRNGIVLVHQSFFRFRYICGVCYNHDLFVMAGAHADDIKESVFSVQRSFHELYFAKSFLEDVRQK